VRAGALGRWRGRAPGRGERGGGNQVVRPPPPPNSCPGFYSFARYSFTYYGVGLSCEVWVHNTQALVWDVWIEQL